MRFFYIVFFLYVYTLSPVISEEISSGYSDIIGEVTHYTTSYEDTLIDLARSHNLSFNEILSANPNVKDPWVPGGGVNLLMPTEHLLPSGKREGIIINIADLRAYYFSKEKFGKIYSFPIGIGRHGWNTPLGKAYVTNKRKNPSWNVPKSIREEDPTWPPVVPPGPENPLGSRAIYLSMPSYLLHGTNKPWGVGMRVSHGCIRLYPEGIEELYDLVEVNTKINIVDQPVKVGWKKDFLFIEVHHIPSYARELEAPSPTPPEHLLPVAAEVIQRVAGTDISLVNWDHVISAVMEGSGYPKKISDYKRTHRD